MSQTDPTRVAGSDPRPSGAYRLNHHAPGGPKVEPIDTPDTRRAEAAAAAPAPADVDPPEGNAAGIAAPVNHQDEEE